MAFAIFYNRQDLTPIAAEVTRADLAPSDKSLCLKVWNGGLDTWNTAPIDTSPRCEGDSDCRIVVINAAGVTAQDFIDFLRRQSSQPGAEYLWDLANDMSCYADPNCAGCVEPWPQL